MARSRDLPIYHAGYALLKLVTEAKAFYERAALCRLAQRKGHSVDGKFTRIYKRKGVA